MLLRLVLLFVTVPLAELALLVWIGDRVGLVPTLVLVVATGILGATLARHQGLAAWRRFRTALDSGRLPHQEIAEGLMVLAAAAVLLTPGLITDLAGFALLVPPLRRRTAAAVVRRLTRRAAPGSRDGAPSRRPDAVDVEFRVVDPEDDDSTP